MKTERFDIRKSKKYLIVFIFVMLLNLGLGIFLIHTALAQKSDNDYQNQPPLSVEVVSQVDSPLLITILNVDNSNSSYQTVNYTVQNVSKMPIRAYTFLGYKKQGGKFITNSFTTKLFQPKEVKVEEFVEERANIKSDEKLSLSIDYVDFSDGSSWGEDKYQTSEQIAQERAGRKAAIKHLKSVIDSQGQTALLNLLEQDILDLQVPIPDSKMSEQSQRGFRAGYKSVVSAVQENKNQENKILLKKLDEMEQVIGRRLSLITDAVIESK